LGIKVTEGTGFAEFSRQMLRASLGLETKGKAQEVRTKNKAPVLGNAVCFVRETKTGVVHTLVIFKHRPMLSHITSLAETFCMIWLNISLS